MPGSTAVSLTCAERLRDFRTAARGYPAKPVNRTADIAVYFAGRAGR